ncbi:hypothetical protein BH11PSE4_BH11PSE4_25530 [soil metagenome]
MPQRDDAWLRHQQHRFMRSDGARYLRRDMARFLIPGTDPADVYPALARKWAGQPRIPKDEDGGGQFTFGTINVGPAADPDRPRVYIHAPRRNSEDDSEGDGDGESDADGAGGSFSLGTFLERLLLAAGIGPGIGHNQGPALEDPPKVPRSQPRRSSSSHLRSAANWIARARSLHQVAAIVAFFGSLIAIDWIAARISEIVTNLNPPRTMEELQSAVDVPRAGTEIHHWKMEQHVSRNRHMTQAEIDAPGNRVRIPILKHREITDWYRQPNPQFGGRSPRQYLADRPAQDHVRVGREALILFKVLKP